MYKYKAIDVGFKQIKTYKRLIDIKIKKKIDNFLNPTIANLI